MLRGFVRAVHLFYAVLMHCRVTECSKATSCFTGGNVIVMQLDRQPVGAAKVQQHVAFPDELDLWPWMHPESPDLSGNASCMYDLVSLIVHQGKASTGGHYVAVCRLGPAEGICPPHANKGSPNLPQAVASIACTVCCAGISGVTAGVHVVCCSLVQSWSQVCLSAHACCKPVTMDSGTGKSLFGLVLLPWCAPAHVRMMAPLHVTLIASPLLS